jgi:small subunit ribosomal protein S20
VGCTRAVRASDTRPSKDRPEEDMANIKSQIKRNRQNERRHERNKAVRSELKTRTKSVVKAAETGADDVTERLREAVKRIDKAAAKGVIHPNQAARRKSRLVRRIAQLVTEHSGE